MPQDEEIQKGADELVLSNNPRQGMIATAVKFLQNPKVQSSPLEQKKSFLQKKGLTAEEVQLALDQAGITDVAVQVPSAHLSSPAQPYHSLPTVIHEKQMTLWDRFQNYSTVAVIVGGVVYALYSLFKKLIEPIFIRQRREMDEKLSKMEQGFTDLNASISSNIKEVQASINAIKSEVSEQGVTVSRMANNLVAYKVDSSNNGVGELQSEISSLKGLLLSSRQFPAAPVIHPPVIPSWQLKQEEVTSSPPPPQQENVVTSPLSNGISSSKYSNNNNDDDAAGDSPSTLHSGEHQQHQSPRDLEESEDEEEEEEQLLVNGKSTPPPSPHDGATEMLTPSATHVLSV